MDPVPQSTASPIRQGWISLAAWIAFGILIEGLNGFRSPMLMDDLVRREMFRLAHAHGTLLSIVLILAAICSRSELIQLGRFTSFGLRLSAVLLPFGFLLGGIWHYKDDPGLGIFLVPIGGVILLATAVSITLSLKRP